MSIAAFAIAEAAMAEPARSPARTPPAKRQTIAKPDSATAAEPR